MARSMLIMVNMILISVQPFAAKKIFFLVAALLGLSSAACFADSLFLISPVSHTFHSRSLNLPMLTSAGNAKSHHFSFHR